MLQASARLRLASTACCGMHHPLLSREREAAPQCSPAWRWRRVSFLSTRPTAARSMPGACRRAQLLCVFSTSPKIGGHRGLNRDNKRGPPRTVLDSCSHRNDRLVGGHSPPYALPFYQEVQDTSWQGFGDVPQIPFSSSPMNGGHRGLIQECTPCSGGISRGSRGKGKAPWQWLIFPRSCPLSIVGAEAFHFRVRDGNGWFHSAQTTRRQRDYSTTALRSSTLLGIKR